MKRRCIAVVWAAAILSPANAPADDESPPASLSVRDGVFTEAQAARGEALYADPCGKCHGYQLDGAPDDPDMFSTRPVAGPKFLRDWDGQSLAALYEYTRTTMPANNPGYLTPAEVVDILAYMLQRSGLPAGSRPLEAEPAALAGIIIERAEL